MSVVFLVIYMIIYIYTYIILYVMLGIYDLTASYFCFLSLCAVSLKHPCTNTKLFPRCFASVSIPIWPDCCPRPVKSYVRLSRGAPRYKYLS